jgi:hypothetical protein
MKSKKYLMWLTLSLVISATTAEARPALQPFIIKVQTDNEGVSENNEFTIPTTGNGYMYEVDCDNDGEYEKTNQEGNVTCSYLIVRDPPPRTIRIRGDFPRIYFNNEGDKRKIISVEQWGEIE